MAVSVVFAAAARCPAVPDSQAAKKMMQQLRHFFPTLLSVNFFLSSMLHFFATVVIPLRPPSRLPRPARPPLLLLRPKPPPFSGDLKTSVSAGDAWSLRLC